MADTGANQQHVDAAYQLAAKALRQNVPQPEVVQRVIAAGWTANAATQIVADVAASLRQKTSAPAPTGRSTRSIVVVGLRLWAAVAAVWGTVYVYETIEVASAATQEIARQQEMKGLNAVGGADVPGRAVRSAWTAVFTAALTATGLVLLPLALAEGLQRAARIEQAVRGS